MHIQCRSEAPRSRAIAGLVTLLVALMLAWALGVAPDEARASSYPDPGAPAVAAIVDPAVHDGIEGWRGGLTRVSLLPLAPGTVYYTWDQPLGAWQRADGPVVVPEGRHTLHAALVTPDGPVGGRLRLPFKIEYDTPVHMPRGYAEAGSVGAAAGPSATGMVTITVTVRPHPGARVRRIGGADRYETSALISEETFSSADTVIVATGAQFADALAASGLAGCLDAPILLTKPTALPAPVAEEIRRLGASRIVIVGGERAVGPGVADALTASGLDVSRIGGVDRYDTAARIGEEVTGFGSHGGRVFIARGDDFADALSLGPLAYRAKAPLLLVRPTAVPSYTRSMLSASAFSSGCIAGGTVAVSSAVSRDIDRYVGSVNRLAGPTRYSTAVAVASWGTTSGLASYSTVGLATGTVFADALCGGAAIGSRAGVILLTKPDALSPDTETALQSQLHVIEEVQVYGGEAAISPPVVDRLRQILL